MPRSRKYSAVAPVGATFQHGMADEAGGEPPHREAQVPRVPGGRPQALRRELLREQPPTEPGAWRRLTTRVVEGSGWHRSLPSTTEMQPVTRQPQREEEGADEDWDPA